MVIKAFPPVTEAQEDGLLAIGGDLDPESVLLAYRQGIFPWPLNDEILAWFSPPQRAILFLDDLHISRSLKRTLNSQRFTIRFNRRCREVIQRCAARHEEVDGGTWITPEMIDAYCTLHDQGFVMTAETYNSQDQLVGGVYGIRLGKYFSAESMFYLEPDASKVALVALAHHIQELGGTWIDIQVVNPFTATFGATEIPRAEFLELLSASMQSSR